MEKFDISVSGIDEVFNFQVVNLIQTWNFESLIRFYD